MTQDVTMFKQKQICADMQHDFIFAMGAQQSVFERYFLIFSPNQTKKTGYIVVRGSNVALIWEKIWVKYHLKTDGSSVIINKLE